MKSRKYSRGQCARFRFSAHKITRHYEVYTDNNRRKKLPIVLHPHERANLDPPGTDQRRCIERRTDARGRKRDEPDIRHPAIRKGGSAMGVEEAPPKAGEGIPGIGSEEPIVLSLCGPTECAGRVGTKGSSRFPPTNASVVRQRFPQGRYTGVRPLV